uniref:Uncharacterized protein n=1 Tax=Brassica oleracea TaxID=3712 RepID=A0A3P6GM28_BRAOL|nr:unnamed protein product [Brassica oleracea]
MPHVRTGKKTITINPRKDTTLSKSNLSWTVIMALELLI